MRRSIRLPRHDYAECGVYFVTINTSFHRRIFGLIADGVMKRSVFGNIAHQAWLNIGELHPFIRLDEFVVMPNHVHGILWFADENGGFRLKKLPFTAQKVERVFGKPEKRSLASIIRSYKCEVTLRIRELNGDRVNSIWDRNYFEKIVATEGELSAYRNYIRKNPKHWRGGSWSEQ